MNDHPLNPNLLDTEFLDIDGHTIVPGSWLHMPYGSNPPELRVAQVLRYAAWGPLWCCWVRGEGGRVTPLTETVCHSASVKLAAPLDVNTLEYRCLACRLNGVID
jgi:hypothetical protein